MSFIKSSALRWGLLFACLVIGTWIGIFFQHFEATAMLFTNIVDVSLDIKEIDLAMIKFGFLFALKLNLGTLIGGIIGIWLAR